MDYRVTCKATGVGHIGGTNDVIINNALDYMTNEDDGYAIFNHENGETTYVALDTVFSITPLETAERESESHTELGDLVLKSMDNDRTVVVGIKDTEGNVRNYIGIIVEYESSLWSNHTKWSATLTSFGVRSREISITNHNLEWIVELNN